MNASIPVLESIPDNALQMAFLIPGHSDAFKDGWVHTKIVPYTIVAQPLQGRYEITCEGRTALAGVGEAFLVGANRLMSITHHGDPRHAGVMRARWIHFHFTLFETVDFTSLLDIPLSTSRKYGAEFGEIIATLLNTDTTPGASPLVNLARRKELGFQALRILCEIAPMRADCMEFIHRSGRLRPVFSLLRKHMADPITVESMAREAHISLSRFHVLFRKHMGCSPMEYLKILRLAEACRLLAATDMAIFEIAEATGFTNQFHFSREFKARQGATPSAYRKAHTGFLV